MINFCFEFLESFAPDFKKITELLRKDNRDALEVELALRGNRITPNMLRLQNAPRNKTIFHLAIDAEASNSLEFLIERRSDASQLDEPDVNGNTPLQSIVLRARGNDSAALLECLDLLVAAGAHINCRDKNMNTPLQYLVQKRFSEEEWILPYIQSLLRSSAIDLKSQNFDFEEPSNTALGNAKELLEEYSHKFRIKSHTNTLSELYNSLMSSDKSQIEIAFRKACKEPNLDLRNHYVGSKTLLYLLVEQLNFDDINDALNFNFNPWTENTDDHKIPLHVAVARANIPVVNLLLQDMKKKKGVSVVNLSNYSDSLMRKLICNFSQFQVTSRNTDRLRCLLRLLQPDIQLDAHCIIDSKYMLKSLDLAKLMHWSHGVQALEEHSNVRASRQALDTFTSKFR